jgi:hypothetical protein
LHQGAYPAFGAQLNFAQPKTRANANGPLESGPLDCNALLQRDVWRFHAG